MAGKSLSDFCGTARKKEPKRFADVKPKPKKKA